MQEVNVKLLKPGVCVPWEERRNEYEKLLGDEQIVQKAWEDMDKLAYLYIWFCLIQF
ncbi:MAG TPA: hypothetical protein PK878_17440 [bacterium]|nr:hypothetical protein [Candidatus Omnitrophota bacterium]HOJ62070.1 hypothetical protein [bacterium]HOL92797.1 hypothetical protein [bacterium]HPP00361.1 hypothetical protein [bacterium]HXK94589.1 hypothetical protein [bacterium]